MIQIEKGVPIPPRPRKTAVGTEHFSAMGVGDSFAVPIPVEYHRKPGSWAGVNRIRNAAVTYGSRSGKKFTVRVMHDDNVVRVWRTA